MAPVPLKADDLERELNVFPSHRDRQVRGHITASGGDIYIERVKVKYVLLDFSVWYTLYFF